MRNKANLPRTDRDGRGPARSGTGPHWGPARKTKPILAKQAGPPGRPCETKPISRQRPEQAGADKVENVAAAEPNTAKQSQFPAEREQEQVLGGKTVMTDLALTRVSAKQSQFAGPAREPFASAISASATRPGGTGILPVYSWAGRPATECRRLLAPGEVVPWILALDGFRPSRGRNGTWPRRSAAGATACCDRVNYTTWAWKPQS